MNDLLTRSEAEQYLLGRINYERTRAGIREFKLDRMAALLRACGNPQHKFPAVHIAGTKGKGSTAVMVAGCLRQAGYRVGSYTSPHLERVEERIALNGQMCSESVFVDLLNIVRPAVAELDRQSKSSSWDTSPTYFEITTAMAMLAFAEAQVDIAVLEVGLGGRLDSTNLCRPCVSVITSISYDHTRQLGNSLAEIAGEKAGIIKSRIPVVCGVTDLEPLAVIAPRVAEDHDADLLQLNDQFGYQECVFEPSHGLDFWQAQPAPWQMDAVAVGLLGPHQLANASVALATVGVLRNQGWQISEAAARSALKEASCPARIEVVGRHPLSILDSSHNVASVAALVAFLKGQAANRTLVFATSTDKDPAAMMRLLLPHFDRIILTQFSSNPRALPANQLMSEARKLELPIRHCRVQSDAQTAWAEAWAAASVEDDESLVCVTGSFFLAAELRGPMLATCQVGTNDKTAATEVEIDLPKDGLQASP